MKVIFSPRFALGEPAPLSLSCAGDVLTINGTALDFSQVGEGETLPERDDETGEITQGTGHEAVLRVTRVGGELQVRVVLEHALDAPEAVRFPEPVTMDTDGPVPVPGQEL
jgi:hypothetical protein